MSRVIDINEILWRKNRDRLNNSDDVASPPIVAVIGPRTAPPVDLSRLLPPDTAQMIFADEETGIAAQARSFALAHGIPYATIRSNAELYSVFADEQRITAVIDEADIVVIVWDGETEREAIEEVIRYAYSACPDVRVQRYGAAESGVL